MNKLDLLYLGPTPADEPCAQVGQANYGSQARRETKAYCAQLERMLTARVQELGIDREMHIVYCTLKWEDHDFGSYVEAVVKYEASDLVAVELALWLEHNLPHEWDEPARAELRALK